MAEENTVQPDIEAQGQSAPNTSQTDDVDHKALYLKEIENAKAQRKRAQSAETRLTELETKNDSARKLKLQEEGEHTVLIKELEEKVVALEGENKGYRERDQVEKTDLLETFPESERDNIQHLDLKALKSLKNMMGTTRSDNPPEAPGTVAGKTYSLEDMDKVTGSERGDAWKSVLSSYSKEGRPPNA